jgi:hypothetical protein
VSLAFRPRNRFEVQTISNLVFDLVVRQVVDALKNENLKHHQPLEWWASHIAALLRLVKRDTQNRCKNLPIDMRFKFDERILELGNPFKQQLIIEQLRHVKAEVFHCSTFCEMSTE